VLLGTVFRAETKSLLSLADILSFKLIVDAFSLEIKIGKVAELKRRHFFRGESACSPF